MQLRKVKFICSVAGLDTTTGKDFNFGKGVEVELTPAQCYIHRHFIVYLDKDAPIKVNPKTEIPIATELKKPKKEPAKTKRKTTKKQK